MLFLTLQFFMRNHCFDEKQVSTIYIDVILRISMRTLYFYRGNPEIMNLRRIFNVV